MCGSIVIFLFKKKVHCQDFFNYYFSLVMLRVKADVTPTSRHAANGAANTGVSLLTDSVPSRVISVDDRRGPDFRVFLLLGVHQQRFATKSQRVNSYHFSQYFPVKFFRIPHRP